MTRAAAFSGAIFHLQSVLDALDRALLRALQGDARRSFRSLATETGSTVPTVSARIRRMEDAGIILGYSVRLDPRRFGATRDADVDLAAAVHVACHTCGQETSTPLWARAGERQHPFCCPTCKTRFLERYTRLAQGL